MYFWKTKILATQIKETNISEEEQKNYYIATSVLATAFMYIAIAGGTPNLKATLTECVLLIIVTIFGINITFKTNQGNDGSNYISRVVMLGLPILIKIIIFGFLAGVLVGVFMGVADNADPVDSQWGVCAVSVIAQLLFFWRVNVHLCHINT